MCNFHPCKFLCITILLFVMALPVLAQPEIEVVVRATNEWCSLPETMTDGGTYNSGPIKRVVEFKIIISNTGSADLSLDTPLTLTGPGAGIFEWIQQPAAVVGPGSGTEAKFLITGGNKGWNTANLSIGNNDPDENPFDIILNINIAESHYLGQYFNGVLIPYDGFTYDWPVDVAIGSTSKVDVVLFNYDTDGPSCSVGGIEFIEDPYISVNGSSAFTLIQPPDAAFFFDTPYKIKFRPTAAGVQTAEISFRYKAAGTRVFFPFSFTVRANPLCPDIRVRDIFVIDGEGPDIICKIRVWNSGMAATLDKFKNRIYLSEDDQITGSDYQINDWNVHPPLGIDAFATSWDIKTTVTGVPPGEYFLGVIADAKCVIPESDEKNNTGYNDLVKIVIPEQLPDFAPLTLDVPVAALPPVIDGVPDPVWASVCAVPMERPALDGGNTAPEDWLDCYANFRMMIDHEACYLFIEAHDEMLNTSAQESQFKDSFELYFAPDRGSAAALLKVNSDVLQLRYVYGETGESTGILPDSECRFQDTETGYHLEIKIPAGNVAAGLTFGDQFRFDICMNDNDGAGPEHCWTWSSARSDITDNPDCLGVVRIIDYSAEYPMLILQAPSVPVIDGSENEPAWEDIPWIGSNTFVKHSGGEPLTPPFDIQTADGWNDCRFRCKLMWLEDRLYFYGDVYDDQPETSHSDYWMNDGFQIFIDGNNDKGISTDANDHEYMFLPSDAVSGNPVFTLTENGWTAEAVMDVGEDTGIPLEPGHLMGMEIQLNDNDDAGRDLWCRWWSDDDISWSHPSILGTVKLDGEISDIGEAQAASEIRDFYLFQNFPNPFNPCTCIRYSVPRAYLVRLTLFDLLGREVAVLVNEAKTAGVYSAVWNGRDHAAGIYLCRLRAGDFRMTKKLVLQK
ncbi:T9SS type A sorting domain-containing protein [bacterium]|nr:T9SS type A sorting domain-containing protein [bacterium]